MTSKKNKPTQRKSTVTHSETTRHKADTAPSISLKSSGRMEEPVLVTGAMGFIGQRLVNRLLEENYHVITFDLPGQTPPVEWTNKVRYIDGDIANTLDVESAVAQSKTIFHLAAMVGDWGAEEVHHRVTVEGTELLMKAALKQNSRVVLASSIVVYGDQIGLGLCHETLPLGKTFGPYSRSKQAQERLAQQFIRKGLRLTVVRPANVYGAGSKPWVDELSKALKSGSPALISGGNINAGLVHVSNVVELMMTAASKEIAIGETYNICDEEVVSWREYIGEIAKTIDAPTPRSIPKLVANYAATVMEKLWSTLQIKNRPPLTHEALNLVASHHLISIDKAKNELNYTPVTHFKQGMSEVKEYLKTTRS